MTATLRSEREVFHANEPIAMQLEVKNVSDKNLGIPATPRWSYSQSHGPGKHNVRGLYIPSHAAIQVHQLSGVKPSKILSPIACGHPGHPALSAVKAGDAINFNVPVTMVAPLTPGEYEIHVTL